MQWGQYFTLNWSTELRRNEPSDGLWFTESFKTIYKSSVLWSRAAKDPVNREEINSTLKLTAVICNNIIQECIIKYWFWMWNLALEQVGDNTPIALLSRIYQLDRNLWMVVIFIHLIILWESHSPSVEHQSLSQESQVARPQLHADEHRRPKSDPCLGGC